MSIQTIKELLELEAQVQQQISENLTQVTKYEELLAEATSSKEKKNLRGFAIRLRTETNQLLRDHQKQIADLVYDRLKDLESIKVECLIPESHQEEVRQLYLLLSQQGRLNGRYKKLPKAWLAIGYFGGILEELIVVLRIPHQIGLGNKHLHTVKEIIAGVKNFNQSEIKAGKEDIRFLFLTRLMESPEEEVVEVLQTAIKFQGPSKRIGLLQEKDNLYLYAIQGLYGGINPDPRVVTIVTPDLFKEGNVPRYGLHFTKKEIALGIWQKEDTSGTVVRSRNKPLVAGAICRFDRAIHGLTCIDQNEAGQFVIDTKFVGIRDRMVHGIQEKIERPKYQAGLVIDLLKLSKSLPPGMVQINEIGTLLVYDDIPNDCLITCLHEDQDLAIFWRLAGS